MKLECLIKREGPTVFSKDGVEYRFEPLYSFDEEGNVIPGPTTSICEVQKEIHVQALLRGGQYIEYKPRPPIRLTERDTNPIRGITFERHLDGTPHAGYILKDDARGRFGGENGWGPRQDRIPFNSQMNAHQWLRAEIPDLIAYDKEQAERKADEEIQKKESERLASLTGRTAEAAQATANLDGVAKSVTCTVCGAVFDKNINLARHTKMVHPKE